MEDCSQAYSFHYVFPVLPVLVVLHHGSLESCHQPPLGLLRHPYLGEKSRRSKKSPSVHILLGTCFVLLCGFTHITTPFIEENGNGCVETSWPIRVFTLDYSPTIAKTCQNHLLNNFLSNDESLSQ
jgi:hypothetical protein